MNAVILEALATGMPVVSTKHSGIPEEVVDLKSGFLVPEGDYVALADRILYLMGHPEIWPKFGRFGRQFVEQNFNSAELIREQVNYYLELSSSRCPEHE